MNAQMNKHYKVQEVLGSDQAIKFIFLESTMAFFFFFLLLVWLGVKTMGQLCNTVLECKRKLNKMFVYKNPLIPGSLLCPKISTHL